MKGGRGVGGELSKEKEGRRGVKEGRRSEGR